MLSRDPRSFKVRDAGAATGASPARGTSAGRLAALAGGSAAGTFPALARAIAAGTAAALIGWLAVGAAAAQESPGLGVEATPAQVAGWALSVLPDGTGLPPGSGSVAAGRVVFEQKCAACHGAEGQGGPNDQLVGGHGTIDGTAPVKTVGSYWPYATTIFDYVRRAMPFTQPQSLSADEVYAVTAYLLRLNGIVDDAAVMNPQTLPQVRMPNRDNFVWVYE